MGISRCAHRAASARGGDFDAFWLAAATPRMIYVTLQHPSPYYDDSYGVNSANNGPYGDAIMQELIPAVEARFRVIREPWARLLTGGSTGGWIAARAPGLYPDFYGGVVRQLSRCRGLPLSPDRQHLHRRQRVLHRQGLDEGRSAESASARRQHPVDDERRELVRARGRRPFALGRAWDIWEATYRPSAPTAIRSGSGTRTRASSTGRRRDVAQVRPATRARNQLADSRTRKLRHKINIYVGDMDSYYLNNATEMLNDFLKADNPKYTGEIVFQRRAPHCWGPRGGDLMTTMSAHIEKHAPASADVKSWS